MSFGRREATGRSVIQVTVFGDWVEELDRGEWCVVSQGSKGEGGGEWEKGEEEENRKKSCAPSGCQGSSSFSSGRRRRPTSRRPWGTAMGTTGMTREAGVMTRGRGVTRGVTSGLRRWVRRGLTRGVRRKGTRGAEKGGDGSKHAPRQHPTTQER